MARARLRPTREGWAVLLLLGGFALGALNTGTNLLYLCTALLLNVLLLDAAVGGRALAGLVARASWPALGEAGVPLPWRARLQAASSPVRVALRLEERPPGAGGPALPDPPAAAWLGLDAGEAEEGVRQVVFPRRGRTVWPGWRLSCRGWLGLVERSLASDAPRELVITPRVRPLATGWLREQVVADGARSGRTWGPARREAVRGLRALLPGDDPRAIHWRASARRGELMVREFERPGPQGVWVLLALPPGPEEPVVEAAVELAASLVAHHLACGEEVGLAVAGAGGLLLLPPARGARARERALGALALVAPGGPDEGQPEPLARAARAAARPGDRLLLVSCGGAAPGVDRVVRVSRVEDVAAAWADGGRS